MRSHWMSQWLFSCQISSTHAAVPRDVSGRTFHPLSKTAPMISKAIMTFDLMDAGS